MMPKLATIAFLGSASALAPAAFGADVAHPGTVNYMEGAVTIDGQAVTDKSVGRAELNRGEQLSTQQGRAEVLLTPGVFLRLDNDSTVKMISPDLTHTQVELERGRAAIEVDEIHPENRLDIADAGVTTQLVKNGYYEFNADQPMAMVFDGKAAVEVGDGKYRVVKSHHELALAPLADGKSLAQEKPSDFNVSQAKDDLYNWNSLRSQYLAEANNEIARQYVGGPGFAPGWYWDPYMSDYTFIGWDPFISPFGWGFYPFGWDGLYGGWGGWYGHRYYGNRGLGHAGATVRGFDGGIGIGGFHGGGLGGFHGGGGMGHGR